MAPRSKHLESLGEIPLFSALSKRDLQRIAKASNEINRDAGTVLVDQGDAGREAFVIIDGTATVKRNNRKVGTLGPGDAIGELSLLDHGPRTATVTADTPMTLLVLSAREFSGVIEEVPGLAHKLMIELAKRVRELDRQIYG
ncbi:cyclic nucleotide-binding domain-containing protein [Aquihabitans sp. G128]|uniref:cyclic nucleotide-binding domain-containing protein n=1 Tax=Aquihabitans sp. G128 TaxID=2849779 RepID=UPI001C215410|nr:cyclic nucleotide-binding domain-containing protein [Aquihabitans sp. G128]QXC59922.1 cyclic nucleotide-binding domain-containing protein [Aquihabitans sp. G128]